MSEPELVFYHAPRTRSSIVHWLLHELGCPFELQLLDLQKGEHKTPAFLAVNPMGKVPAIRHRGVAVSEVGAICCFLADAYPQAGLAPAIDERLRGPYIRWLFYQAGCVDPALLDRALQRPSPPPQQAGYGSYEAVLGVLEAALGEGPWLLGERFTAADVALGASVRFALMFDMLPKRPAFQRYVERLEQRPALQQTATRDEELAARLQSA